MATQQSLLFSWDDVERLPELRRLEFVLDNLPDGELVGALESRRGRGRDEYPVSAMWRALVAGIGVRSRVVGVAAARAGAQPGAARPCAASTRWAGSRRRGGR